nr:hypothetical protein [Tanacetum cinerariifolium]
MTSFHDSDAMDLRNWPICYSTRSPWLYIVPDVGNNVTEIITPADAALSENDFHLVKNYTTST